MLYIKIKYFLIIFLSFLLYFNNLNFIFLSLYIIIWYLGKEPLVELVELAELAVLVKNLFAEDVALLKEPEELTELTELTELEELGDFVGRCRIPLSVIETEK